MNFTASHLAGVFRTISARVDEASDQLCYLDGLIGDGDHGTTMALGFEAVVQHLLHEDLDNCSLSDLLRSSADHFLNAVGATTGPLYASAFRSAATALQDKTSLPMADAPQLMLAMAEGIAQLGKAQPGDKTMMDVWSPVAQHIRANLGAPLQGIISEIRAIASDGMEMTKTMVASKGRAARLGERSLGHVDPGATSAVIIIGCFCDFFAEQAALEQRAP